jgi:hypothetical protein
MHGAAFDQYWRPASVDLGPRRVPGSGRRVTGAACGGRYRVPAFLATSAEVAVTNDFVYRAYDQVRRARALSTGRRVAPR